VSGDSSTLAASEKLREELAGLLKEYNIKTILDIPCGDFNWMKEMDLAGIDYTGADIVSDLVDLNKEKFGGEFCKFQKLDITADPLPKVDLVICRDCLVHLSNRLIDQALENINRSNSTYLLATTFTAPRRNRNILTGAWRPLNLQREPYNFPEPLMLINENFQLRAGCYPDKSLGLWRLDDIAKILYSSIFS